MDKYGYLTEKEGKEKFPLCYIPISQIDRANHALLTMQDDARRKMIEDANKKYGPIRGGGVFNAISDDLGVNGVFCHADGKTYDSKSAYYKAVRAKGCEIIGNEKVTPKRPEVKDIDWHSAVAETLNRTGY